MTTQLTSAASRTSPTRTGSLSRLSAGSAAGAALVAAARACLGVPFAHQGRDPARGLDCLGLVLVAAKAAGLLAADYDKADYAAFPDAAEMTRELRARLLLAKEEDGDGVIARFSVEGRAIHLGVLTAAGTVIHATSRAGRVVEHRLTPALRAQIVELYRLPPLRTRTRPPRTTRTTGSTS